jgi:hypothetical protein
MGKRSGRFGSVLMLGMTGALASAHADDALNRRAAIAVENVALAKASCGMELSFLARQLILRDKRHEPRLYPDQRAVIARQWRETFACNPGFAGQNCFAARWQLCQRAYAEYGPQGILMKGLIRPIIKK